MELSEDAVRDPSFLADLRARPLAELRAQRGACQRLGDALSYARRLAQGRLDIVTAERDRRAAGGDPHDLGSLVASLPDTLSGHTGPSRPGAAPVRVDEHADEAAAAVVAPLDEIVDESGLVRLPDRRDDELGALAERLGAFERDVSARRKDVYAALDALSAELTRRYRDGEATVDALLQPGSG